MKVSILCSFAALALSTVSSTPAPKWPQTARVDTGAARKAARGADYMTNAERIQRKLPLNPPVRRAPRNKAKAKRLDPAPAAAMASGSSTRYSFTFCTYEDPRELIVRDHHDPSSYA